MPNGTTGPNGRVTFDLPIGNYLVHSEHPQYRVPPDQTVSLPEAGAEASFALDPRTGTLGVTVLDRAGQPVPGATVIVTLST